MDRFRWSGVRGHSQLLSQQRLTRSLSNRRKEQDTLTRFRALLSKGCCTNLTGGSRGRTRQWQVTWEPLQALFFVSCSQSSHGHGLGAREAPRREGQARAALASVATETGALKSPSPLGRSSSARRLFTTIRRTGAPSPQVTAATALAISNDCQMIQ